MKLLYFKINFIFSIIITCLLVSCTNIKKSGIELIQTPKESFFYAIMDLGNLIGNDEKLLLNIIDDFRLSKSLRKQNSNIEPERVKVIQVKIKNEREHLWFVDGILTEIHIPVGTKGVFEIFSSDTLSEEIIEIMGNPFWEYGSKSYPNIRNLMYNSTMFSLHFVLSNVNLDKHSSKSGKNISSKKNIEPHLKEIRLAPPNKKPIFIGVLEKEIYSSGHDLYGLD